MPRLRPKLYVDELGISRWKREFGQDVMELIRSKLVDRMRIKDISMDDISGALAKLYPSRKLSSGAFRVYKCRIKKGLTNGAKD